MGNHVPKFVNPDKKPPPTASIGISHQPQKLKSFPQLAGIIEPKSYDIFQDYLKARIPSIESKIDEFNRRLDQNVDLQRNLDDRIKKSQEQIQKKHMERIRIENLNGPDRPTYIDQKFPINQIHSLEHKFKSINFFDLKYFSTKPKWPDLSKKSIQDHLSSVSVPYPLNEPLIELDGVQILRKDIQTLLGLNWLNDEIINAYMYLLVCRGKIGSRKRVYAFNTFFYPKIRDSGYNSVKRWTRKVDIFSYDYILVPVHLGNHWCLALIDFQSNKISYYDSLGGSSHGCCERLLDYLREEKSDKKKQELDQENWTCVDYRGGKDPDIPAQENGSDCGVFACTYAEYLTRPAKFNFSQKNMSYFRKKMIYEITTGEILE